MTADTAERLVYMANQIAAFFASQRHERAVLGAADHLAAFWTPAMREAILAEAREGESGLSALARESVLFLGERSGAAVSRQLESEGGISMPQSETSDAG